MFQGLVERIFSEKNEEEQDQEITDNNSNGIARKQRRMPRSRNSDWNELVEDKSKNVFFKVFAGADRRDDNKLNIGVGAALT